jgi:hypothetical protein
MQQTQTPNYQNPRLSTSSHSSLSTATNTFLNGLLPPHRFSQTSANAPPSAANLTPIQLKALQNGNNQLKRWTRIKNGCVIICLTILLAFLLLITIELAARLVKIQPEIHLWRFSNLSSINNITIEEHYPIRAFFTCVWIFNSFLFIHCFLVHCIGIQQHSRRILTTAVFVRY